MSRTPLQARYARKLRRDHAGWIGANPDAAALAQQLVYLAVTMDTEMAEAGRVTAKSASAYLATRTALFDLQPEA